MKAESSPPARCGPDSVELARVEKLVQDKTPEELRSPFTERELADAGTGAGRIVSLAGRFAAKEACCKFFPRELALGQITPRFRNCP
jgi:phosphopantetheinyl transferase (holo-ACP synthase)